MASLKPEGQWNATTMASFKTWWAVECNNNGQF
jgi:hypothetical protein